MAGDYTLVVSYVPETGVETASYGIDVRYPYVLAGNNPEFVLYDACAPLLPPPGCGACRGRADVFSRQGDSGAGAFLYCESAACSFTGPPPGVSPAQPGYHSTDPDVWVRVGAYMGGRSDGCSPKTPTPPTAPAEPSTTAYAATATPGDPGTPTGVTMLTETPATPVVATPTPTSGPDATPLPCPNPVQGGLDYQMEAGAAPMWVHTALPNGWHLVERQFHDYFYFNDGGNITVSMFDFGILPYESLIMSERVWYAVHATSSADVMFKPLVCGTLGRGLIGTCITFQVKDSRGYRSATVAVSGFSARGSGLLCGRTQKAFAGALLVNQSGWRAAKGDVHRPKVYQSRCPCEFICPSLPEVCIPPNPWVPPICFDPCFLYEAACQVGDLTWPAMLAMEPVGYDVSDRMRLTAGAANTYRFCGPTHVVEGCEE